MSGRRIAIIEDERAIASAVAARLRSEGFEVELAFDGPDGVDLCRTYRPDVVILDLMLPGLDGLEVCRLIQRDRHVPVLMLTARDNEADIEVALDVGADDYMVKPFSPKELAARVAALLRRLERPKAGESLLRHGPLTIDIARHQVRMDDEEVRLTAKEFLLLRYLIEHRGRVLSRDRLLTDVWGYQYTGGTRTVDVHVRRLREKIPWLSTAITTIKQFGYKLDEAPAGQS